LHKEPLLNTISEFAVPGIIFLLTLVFGFWLSLYGKPYNGILFNVHKLIALGTVVLTSVQVYKSLKVTEPRPLLIVSIVIVVACVVALFVSGAFLSIGNMKYETLKLIHNIAPILMVLAMGSIVYLFSKRIP
jgi:hypothetical protein